jgi:glycine/D-amino acid oxidase-like deaminating enzyme/nitrite reductase/ring-hydroxylating ferredoxin subunit
MSCGSSLHKSLWVTSHVKRLGEFKSFPRLAGKLTEKFDVAVIGAGMFGLTTALKLHEEGKRPVVLEAHRVGMGVGGFSTAKLCSLQRNMFTLLHDKFGDDMVKPYGRMNQEAIDDIERLVNKYNIDCCFRRAAHTTFAMNADERETIGSEYEGTTKAGLASREIRDSNGDLPATVPFFGGVRAENQAHFNSYSYMVGLADVLDKAGVPIYEMTRAQDVSMRGPPHTITTVEGGELEADQVVVATHLPFLDRTGHFTVTEPDRSYVIAASLTDPSEMIKEMYISVTKPQTRSMRPYDDGTGEPVLVVCGNDHPAGDFPKEGAESCYDDLEKWTRQHFPVKEIVAKWSAFDYRAADKIPYIGYAHHGTNTVYTATGFMKWGHTNGHAAAGIITDLIMGRANPYAELFDARRWDLTHSIFDAAKIQAHVTKHFVGDRVKHMLGPDIEDLKPGCGGICKDRGSVVAAYMDESGQVYKFSATCTHLGCHVNWNDAEKSYDCPCHGSRFDAKTGAVLHGPSTKALPSVGPSASTSSL